MAAAKKNCLEKTNGHESGSVSTKGGRAAKTANVTIAPPNFQVARFTIVGTAPYVQQRFSVKARQQIRETQESGSTRKSKKGKKEPKDFQKCYEESMYQARDGWRGIPAAAFRVAMIEACRTVGFKMTMAKTDVFVIADGFDKDDGTALVRITSGDPNYFESAVRIPKSGSCDIRARAMWHEGWEAEVQVRFDADTFTLSDIANLLMRAGISIGVGEGRPFSKQSAGMNFGTFSIKQED